MCGADLSDLDEEKSDPDERNPKKRKTDLAGAPAKNGAKDLRADLSVFI